MGISGVDPQFGQEVPTSGLVACLRSETGARHATCRPKPVSPFALRFRSQQATVGDVPVSSGLRRPSNMCYKAVCSKCNKATWSGCGRHIDSVRIPARCPYWPRFVQFVALVPGRLGLWVPDSVLPTRCSPVNAVIRPCRACRSKTAANARPRRRPSTTLQVRRGSFGLVCVTV